MALRRMNSEANYGAANGGRLSREHKRYLSLSGDDAASAAAAAASGVREDSVSDDESGPDNLDATTPDGGVGGGDDGAGSLRTPRSERRWWRNSGLLAQEGGAGKAQVVRGPRAMPFFDAGTMSALTKERVGGGGGAAGAGQPGDVEGSLYDESGFLKE